MWKLSFSSSNAPMGSHVLSWSDRCCASPVPPPRFPDSMTPPSAGGTPHPARIVSRAADFAASTSASLPAWSSVTFPPPLEISGAPMFFVPRFRDRYRLSQRVSSSPAGRSTWRFAGSPLRSLSFSVALAEEAVAARDKADARLQRVQDAEVVTAEILLVTGEQDDRDSQGREDEEVDHTVERDQAQDVTVPERSAP